MLLILAVVAIGAVQNDGIIGHAKNAREEYGKAQVNENTTLENYLEKLEENLPGDNGEENNSGDVNSIPDTTMTEAQEDTMLEKTVNSNVVDKYNNKITVPAGFKILVDNTTGYTTEDIDVTKGIVITDGTNEFVWVPVGNIYQSETEYKTITLGRYSSFTANDAGEYTPAQTAENYATATTIDTYFTEDTADNHNSDYGNAIAKDIGAFVNSATTKGGYYLGRYEAGNLNDTLVCKANQIVYSAVTQPEASNLSQNMYKDATTFTSDLVNSYAWDTAIVFIQAFSTETDASNYSNLNKCTSFVNTGVHPDKYCNIYDMSGNACEWSTETRFAVPCVMRGGKWYGSSTNGYSMEYTSSRVFDHAYSRVAGSSFRPLLYVAM